MTSAENPSADESESEFPTEAAFFLLIAIVWVAYSYFTGGTVARWAGQNVTAEIVSCGSPGVAPGSGTVTNNTDDFEDVYATIGWYDKGDKVGEFTGHTSVRAGREARFETAMPAPDEPWDECRIDEIVY